VKLDTNSGTVRTYIIFNGYRLSPGLEARIMHHLVAVLLLITECTADFSLGYQRPECLTSDRLWPSGDRASFERQSRSVADKKFCGLYVRE